MSTILVDDRHNNLEVISGTVRDNKTTTLRKKIAQELFEGGKVFYVCGEQHLAISISEVARYYMLLKGFTPSVFDTQGVLEIIKSFKEDPNSSNLQACSYFLNSVSLADTALDYFERKHFDHLFLDEGFLRYDKVHKDEELNSLISCMKSLSVKVTMVV